MNSGTNAVSKVRALLEEITLYWNNPRPCEYVPYKNEKI